MEKLKKTVTSGNVYSTESKPVREVSAVTDETGAQHRTREVRYGKSLPPFGGRFELFGDVPQEMLDFLPGKFFALYEYHRNGSKIPVRQELYAMNRGEAPREYVFQR